MSRVKIEEDCVTKFIKIQTARQTKRGLFLKLVSLTVFHISFLLFVTFNIMLWERCLLQSCDFVFDTEVNVSLMTSSLANKDAL